MNDNLKDILSGLNKDIEQEKLLQYLNDHLKDDEQHAFEKQMNDDEFMSDAVEGLQQVTDKKNIELSVQQLNNELKKQVAKRKNRKEKRKLKDQGWIYFAAVLIIFLIIITYLVIKRLHG